MPLFKEKYLKSVCHLTNHVKQMNVLIFEICFFSNMQQRGELAQKDMARRDLKLCYQEQSLSSYSVALWVGCK